VKIISWNVNGLRSAANKGLLDFMREESPDIYCLQEIKVQKDQLSASLANPKGYYSYFNEAGKKGYSGVAVYTKQEPLRVLRSLGDKRFDSEGRLLILEFQEFILINVYIPHGGRNKENLDYKLEAYKYFFEILNKFKQKKTVLIGDFNIAHTSNDLANPAENTDNIMFTTEERKQIDFLLKAGFIDSFRLFNKENGNYTWWSYAFNARARNIGWRIDYAFVSPKLLDKVEKTSIYKDVQGSDHCPIGLELKI
jgi:exodeoxyribonuclease III